MTAPIYPDIKVQLTGRDGNAFAILGAVTKALRHGGLPEDRCALFVEEATSGDYDNVLATAMKWVDVS